MTSTFSQRLKRLRAVCNKYRWFILLFAWVTAYTALRHVEESVERQARAAVISMDEKMWKQIPVQYDAILSSYMRGGSTLLGLVLGFRNDTFYVYEPLWKLSRWTYWRGNSTVCRQDNPECRHVEPEMDIDRAFADNKDKDSPGGSLVMAKKILRKMYDCLFNDSERTMVEEGLTVRLGGPSWDKVRSCLKRYKNLKFCLHKYAPDKCKRSRHKVSKVLRLTLDNMAPILKERGNLKVVHLFRDPRAVINSRLETGWFPAKSKPEIINNTRSLCAKMMFDYEAGLELAEKYTNRFRFMYYEDFTVDPLAKAKALYSYLGMNLNKERYKRVTQVSIFNNKTPQTDRHANTAFWWRKTLDWDTVKEIDTICDDVIKALGYVSFETEADLRDFSLQSVVVPHNYSLIRKEAV